MNQYDIVLVNLDPTVGSEIQKTRLCVIVSPDEINHNLQTLVVIPMTTTSRKYPTRVEVKHNGKTGWIAIDQIRTIDKVRVIKILGTLNKSEIREVKSVIKETFVD
ncbi:MAG: type II toxin-antitoxin system PemK/MazF family toxin [Paludibacter sp.]|nr:type II toxin-antitoxin system PemK/MazF family toxin [Paludibacter sp.]